MFEPPGEPSAKTGLPSLSTIVGDIDERGRLPGSTRLATAAPSFAGREGEVGELVVEQEAVDHQPRAERVLDRRRHRGDVAVGVDDDEMRGRRHLERDAVDAQFGLVPGRLAGLDLVLAAARSAGGSARERALR